RDPVRGDGLRRALVLAAARGVRRVHRLDPTPRDGRGAAAHATGAVHRRRSPGRARPLRLRPRHLRVRRRVPPRGRGRVRAAVGPVGGDLVEAPARRGTGGQAAIVSEDSKTLWHGRFADGPDAALMALSESLSFDRRLAADDVEGSRAHVAMLVAVGLLTDAEGRAVTDALDNVESELATDTFVFTAT